MKSIFTLLFFIVFILSEVYSQGALLNNGAANINVRLRGQTSISTTCKTLFVVDGVFIDSITEMDPDEIESITVLKKAAVDALFGCRAFDGCVILITLKERSQLKIEDATNGAPLAMATCKVRFGKDSAILVSDDKGIVDLEELKIKNDYSVEVSSVGYFSSFKTVTKESKGQQEISLERDIVLSEEVIVTANGTKCKRICKLFCTSTITHSYISEAQKVTKQEPSFRLYPNPVAKGSSITIEMPQEFTEGIMVMSDAMGKRVHTETIKNSVESNRMVLQTRGQWAAGVYFINLVSVKGEKFPGLKLIIQ
jgi:hypothetical protein